LQQPPQAPVTRFSHVEVGGLEDVQRSGIYSASIKTFVRTSFRTDRCYQSPCLKEGFFRLYAFRLDLGRLEGFFLSVFTAGSPLANSYAREPIETACRGSQVARNRIPAMILSNQGIIIDGEKDAFKVNAKGWIP
jgi:hypothetical protein